jgi:V8-like Glu-specific endopeptidase
MFCPLFAAACAAASDTEAPREQHGSRDSAILSDQVAILFPEVVEIDLFTNNTSFFDVCTGTLLSPDAVLTAAHCLMNAPTRIVVRSFAGTEIEARQTIIHPTLDIAMLLLKQNILLPVPAISPNIATDPAKVNETVDVVGRMSFANDKGAARFTATTTVRQMDSTLYSVNEVTDRGDSGGPMFRLLTSSGIPQFPRTLYGVLSKGGFGTDKFVRIDQADVRKWIDAAKTGQATSGAPAPGPTDGKSGCGNITFDGICNGDTLLYCDQGQLETIACGDFGGTCGPVEPSGVDCLYEADAPPEDPCEGVTFEGQCDGDVLSWCQDGLNVIDCAAQGAACAFNDAQGYFDCM